ncbi:MAG TPA: RNase A-like domain-containing protein [Pseudomonas sp.]|uniref:RNase A-like domain-containing protein n=1 Tax=Pseudomonas sp. TaxID=306 RepID=UPI002ED90AFB
MYSKVKFLLKRPQVEFDTHLGRVIGWGITKQLPNDFVNMLKIRAIIKFTDFNNMPYFIITAFPIK